MTRATIRAATDTPQVATDTLRTVVSTIQATAAAGPATSLAAVVVNGTGDNGGGWDWLGHSDEADVEYYAENGGEDAYFGEDENDDGNSSEGKFFKRLFGGGDCVPWRWFFLPESGSEALFADWDSISIRTSCVQVVVTGKPYLLQVGTLWQR
jgi:hypothetical protein